MDEDDGILGLTPGATKKSESNLNNVFNFALPSAQTSQAAGASDTSAASNYWKGILSGNRSALMASAAPEINAVNSNADATRRDAAASGTARGGGATAANRQAGDQTTAAITDALFKQRPQAAQGAAQVGATELSDASNKLGLGIYATSSAGNQALEQEKIAQSSIGQEALAGVISPAIDKGAGKFSEALNWLI